MTILILVNSSACMIFFNDEQNSSKKVSGYELLYDYLCENEEIMIKSWENEEIEEKWDPYDEFEEEYYRLYINNEGNIISEFGYI